MTSSVLVTWTLSGASCKSFTAFSDPSLLTPLKFKKKNTKPKKEGKKKKRKRKRKKKKKKEKEN
jgi:hypothetical protein